MDLIRLDADAVQLAEDQSLKRLLTNAGDRLSIPAEYSIGLVLEKGQQDPEGTIFRSMRAGSRVAAETLAREFVAENGTVFLLEKDSDTWTRIVLTA